MIALNCLIVRSLEGEALLGSFPFLGLTADLAAIVLRNHNTRRARASARIPIGPRAEPLRISRIVGRLVGGLAGVLDPDEHGALIGSDEYTGDLALLRTDKKTADLAGLRIGAEHLIVAESGVVAGVDGRG